MIAFIYGMFLLISHIGSVIRDESFNSKSKRRYSEKYGVYGDRNGLLRDYKTDKPVRILYEGNDIIVTNFKDINRNITASKRNQIINNALQKQNCKITAMAENKNDKHICEPISGIRYRDVKNNKLYVCRKINGIVFYVDILTQKAVRRSDGEIRSEEELIRRCGSKEDAIARGWFIFTDEQINKLINKYNNSKNKKQFRVQELSMDLFNYEDEMLRSIQ